MIMARPFEAATSGVINITRSTHSVSYMNKFQTAFRAVVLARTRVIHRSPDVDNLRRSRTVLKWFVPPGSHSIAQRVLLSLDAQGDWLDTEHVNIYVLPGTIVDEASVKSRVADAITSALCHRKWQLYMRKKHGGQRKLSATLLYHSFAMVC
jgi:hypothetical protein